MPVFSKRVQGLALAAFLAIGLGAHAVHASADISFQFCCGIENVWVSFSDQIPVALLTLHTANAVIVPIPKRVHLWKIDSDSIHVAEAVFFCQKSVYKRSYKSNFRIV